MTSSKTGVFIPLFVVNTCILTKYYSQCMHSCLKPFSIGPKVVFKQQKPCSNHEIHMPFEHGFWLKSVDITVFRRNKMADNEEALCFLLSFYFVNVIFKIFMTF